MEKNFGRPLLFKDCHLQYIPWLVQTGLKSLEANGVCASPQLNQLARSRTFCLLCLEEGDVFPLLLDNMSLNQLCLWPCAECSHFVAHGRDKINCVLQSIVKKKLETQKPEQHLVQSHVPLTTLFENFPSHGSNKTTSAFTWTNSQGQLGNT